MQESPKYGQLLQPTIKLHRAYFKEMVKLLGIYCVYRYPLSDKHYTTYAEMQSNYSEPMLVGCIFNDHPDQKTLKKIGWIAELQQNASIIHVDYDLPNLQRGCLFIVPSGLDDGKGRVFKVTDMQVSMVYPSSVVCEIVPEYIDTIVQETLHDYSSESFTALNHEEDNNFA